jgi:hypothetical protein
MQRYVAHHPDGHWVAGVQRERARRDVSTFESGKSSRAGLSHYLAAFPDGVFAEQARSRLAALDLIDQRKREAEARASVLTAERKAREEELRRTWVTRFSNYWATTLLAIGNWGAPIPDVAHANPTFSRAFGAEPRPRCSADECVKYYTGHYAIPVPGGTRVERTLSLVLRLRMRAGKLERAELLLPERGFSRVYELENKRVVIDSDPDGRKAAVAWMIEQLAPALKALGEKTTAEADYALAKIEPPAIGPSGELTDTAAEDPSVPPNRLQGEGAAAAPSVEQLVAPKNEPAPDMVFNPMQVDKEGHAKAAPDMVMAPAVVPANEAQVAPDIAPVVQSHRAHGLRLVVFAAGGAEASPAYDGLIIERVAP